jgi:hypothetical protein
MSFFDKFKKAGKSVVDAGAKQMLKVRLHCDTLSFAVRFSLRFEFERGSRRLTRLAHTHT